MSTRTFLPVRASRRGTELFLLVFALTLGQMQLSKRWVHYEGD